MKIAFLGPAYPFRGGIVKFSTQLAKELSKNNEVRFFSFKKQYPALFFPGKKQKDFTAVKPDFPITPVLVPYNPFSWLETVKSIREWQPELLILNYWIPFFAPAFGYVVSKIKSLQIAIIHNVEFHEKWIFANKLTRYALGKCDQLYTLSDAVWKDAQRIFPGKKIIAAFHPPYNCYNNNRYSPKTAKQQLKLSGRQVILFFGYIKPYKGLDLLIDAFFELKKQQKNIHLLIVGEVYGDDKIYYDILRKYDLEADTTFINRYVSDDEIELYFKAADILVLPYKQGTQSGVLQIAHNMGLGAVVTPVGGLPEMIETGKTGWVAKDITAEALKDALASYLKLDLTEVSKNCIEKSKQQSWSGLAELLIKKVQAET